MCKKHLKAHFSFFNLKERFRNENDFGDKIYFGSHPSRIMTSTSDNLQRTVHLGSHVENKNRMHASSKIIIRSMLVFK